MSDENKKMEEIEELGELTKLECFKCVGLMIAGGILFSFIPDDVGILGWILFAVGIFLFVIGVFRLAAFLHKPEGRLGSVLWLALFILAAISIQISGLFYLYDTGGTEKGIIIATFALCASLGLIIFAVDPENQKQLKAIIVISRILCIVILGFAVYLNVRDGFSDASIYVGTMLLIDFFIVGKYSLISLKSVSDENHK